MADRGRVLKVSETTEIKGQFGHGQSSGPGKKLKIFYILQMSKFLQPPHYKGKSLENQLRNCMYGIHDLMCGCNDVQQHLTTILNPEKCLPITTGTVDGKNRGEEEDVFDAGDLDALFAATDDADG